MLPEAFSCTTLLQTATCIKGTCRESVDLQSLPVTSTCEGLKMTPSQIYLWQWEPGIYISLYLPCLGSIQASWTDNTKTICSSDGGETIRMQVLPEASSWKSQPHTTNYNYKTKSQESIFRAQGGLSLYERDTRVQYSSWDAAEPIRMYMASRGFQL